MAAPTASRQRPDQALVYAALVIVAGVLATTLAQTQVLARLPLQNLLKNELHADRTANAAFLPGLTRYEHVRAPEYSGFFAFTLGAIVSSRKYVIRVMVVDESAGVENRRTIGRLPISWRSTSSVPATM